MIPESTKSIQDNGIVNVKFNGQPALDQEGVSEIMLSFAVNHLGAGVFICEAGWPDCPILHAADGFTAITCYPVQETVGRNPCFLLASENDLNVTEGLRQALANHRPFKADILCQRRKGPNLWCELVLTPFSLPGNSALHFVGLLTDISLRRQREEHFKDTEARYRGMFENAVEGIYQSTPGGHYLVVNPALARMYGYDTPEELLGQVSDISLQIYVEASQREIFRKEIERAGQICGFEYQVRRRDGAIIWISESARAVRDRLSRVRYYEGFIEEITQRKEAEVARARMERQMVHAQKMEAIGTLAGGIAHDFNNILCAMLGLTELALAQNQVTGQTRKNLEAVLKSADRAKDLIRQILTFSRRGESERKPIRLSSVLKECMKLLNATLPASVRIELHLNTGDDTIFSDATEMHQVIMNLGTNAAHAMRLNGGCLDYRLEAIELSQEQAAHLSPLRAGPHLCITVNDTGHGMSREIMESIFDPFFTTKPEGEGTGLGLTLVHRIVSHCNGHILVDSQEGAGTTFRVFLPRAPNDIPAPDPCITQVLQGRRERVLIVDDEINILHMMQQRLNLMGYRAMTRADSTAALEMVQSDPSKIDLVITDHTMPILQGADLAEKLGRLRPDLPVILMTGLNQPPDFAHSNYASRRAVIRKPLDFVELSHRMRQFLEVPVSAKFTPPPGNFVE